MNIIECSIEMPKTSFFFQLLSKFGIFNLSKSLDREKKIVVVEQSLASYFKRSISRVDFNEFLAILYEM